MPRVTADLVDHLALLARLSLSGDERDTLARDLEEILAYAGSIQALDTTDVPPMSHAHTSGSFREDAPHPGLPRERALDGAPDPGDGLFRVPRILGG
jgi:aspartyl-tRNA(Asn)/glutamyl-tRNA(Gln) amidotransferase subunit C